MIPIQKGERLVQIRAKWFVAGLVLVAREETVNVAVAPDMSQTLRVVATAPIVSYMKGWSYDMVRSYCRTRGWKLTRTFGGSHAD